MSIYDKIADIQMELLDVAFEQKRGFHGKYMGLEVLTCKILPKCYEHGLFYYFTTDETHLILKIIDRETKETLSPAPHVRLPELSKDMKVEGGNYTYMKRYLLMNTFLIIAESFDPDDISDGLPPENNNDASSANNTKESVKKQEKPAETVNVDIPKRFNDAIDILHKKGIEDTEIKHDAIRKTIFKNGNFNKAEKDAIAAYCKNNWRPSK